jgi:hypothetical protein
MKKRLAIFKAGTHRAEDGRTYTFSEGDVAAIAAAYDPSLHQAPYVLGHPKNSERQPGAARTRDRARQHLPPPDRFAVCPPP